MQDLKELICIVCPNSCHLSLDENGNVVGNKCPRGKAFFENELKCPMRTLQTTVKTSIKGVRVISVKTSAEVKKDLIPAIMKELNKFVLDHHVKYGEVIIENILDSGANILVTSDLLEEEQ